MTARRDLLAAEAAEYRDVYLMEGEILCEIVKDPARPSRIIASSILFAHFNFPASDGGPAAMYWSAPGIERLSAVTPGRSISGVRNGMHTA